MSPAIAEERAIMRERAHPKWCDEHQRVHDKADRLRVLRKLLPASADELKLMLGERFSCLYGDTGVLTAGGRMLLRDLHAVGSTCTQVADDYRWSEAKP